MDTENKKLEALIKQWENVKERQNVLSIQIPKNDLFYEEKKLSIDVYIFGINQFIKSIEEQIKL